MDIKKIKWVHVDGRPISKWFGKVNDRLLFEICHFKNDRFDDHKLMTYKVFVMEMKKSADLEELMEAAQALLEENINSFKDDKKTR